MTAAIAYGGTYWGPLVVRQRLRRGMVNRNKTVPSNRPKRLRNWRRKKWLPCDRVF